MVNRFLVFVLVAAGLVGALYIVLCALLYAMQDEMIFFRVANDRALAKQWQAQRVEISGDEVTVEGWWAENANASDVTLLYFGGNAEDVLYTAERVDQFTARRMLVTNYRGYGATPGKPSQQALYKDALTIYDYAVKQPGVTADSIVVVGRSLGSGVATYIAANRPVRGVVLVTPYDSMASVAQAHYPYFPVRLLLKHKFSSDSMAGKILAPALLIASQQDVVIPPIHAQRLFTSWAGPKNIHVLKNTGHNDIEQHEQYYKLINDFIDKPIAR